MSAQEMAVLWSMASGSFSQVSCAGCILHLWGYSLPAQESPHRASSRMLTNSLAISVTDKGLAIFWGDDVLRELRGNAVS